MLVAHLEYALTFLLPDVVGKYKHSSLFCSADRDKEKHFIKLAS
jgi:hypothetical protein